MASVLNRLPDRLIKTAQLSLRRSVITDYLKKQVPMADTLMIVFTGEAARSPVAASTAFHLSPLYAEPVRSVSVSVPSMKKSSVAESTHRLMSAMAVRTAPGVRWKRLSV